MPSRSYALLFALLAAAAAVVFLALSIDHDFYAPGARAVREHVAMGGLREHLPPRVERDLTASIVLRKLYSVGAFTIVGFFAAPLLDGRRRLLGTALLIAAFSTIIEIAQKLSGSAETLHSNLFDIACGGLGGLIGAGLWDLAVRVSQRRRAS